MVKKIKNQTMNTDKVEKGEGQDKNILKPKVPKHILKHKEKFIPLLKILKNMKLETRNVLLDFLSDESIENVCECVYNSIHTDLKLAKKKKLKLKKFLKTNCNVHNLQKIVSTKVPLFKRRNFLKMEGKGLPMILGAAILFLIDLIFGRK